MNASDDYLLTDGDLGREIGRSKNWLAKLRMTGDGPRFLKIGGAIRYRRSAIDEWLRSYERASTGDRPGRVA